MCDNGGDDADSAGSGGFGEECYYCGDVIDYSCGVCGSGAVGFYNDVDYTGGVCGGRVVSHYADADDTGMVCKSGSLRGCDYDGDNTAGVCGSKVVSHYGGINQ